jgi:hypothetical protein
MWKRLTTLITCTLFVPGCEPTGTGDVNVQWAVGLSGSCSEASLGVVVARLETTDGILVAREDQLCESGGAQFQNVPVGSFRARLVGLDEGGIEAYEAAVPGITVTDGVEAGPFLGRLAPRPGEIGLTWFFQGGRLCAAYDVGTVVAHLFTDDAEVVRREFSCDRGAAVLGDLHAGSYDVRVEGLDGRGETTQLFERAGIEVRPGHHVDLDAPLVECNGQCL